MAPFEFKRPGCDTEIRQAAFGYVTDLNRFTQLHLDENESKKVTLDNNLTEPKGSNWQH